MGSVKGDKGIKTEQDGNLKVQKEKKESKEKKKERMTKKQSSMYFKGWSYKM